MYFKALVEGLVEIPPIPFSFRKEIRIIQKKLGQKKFYKKLLKIDPLSSNKITSLDVQRSIRAFEVKIYTKKSIFEWYENTRSDFKKEDFYKIIINYPRHLLIKKIDFRTHQMLKKGAILEVKKFSKLKISKDKSISKAIGINEIKEFLKKKASKDAIAEKISIKTRQYAKRQLTWARGHMKSWKKINHNSLNIFLKKI